MLKRIISICMASVSCLIASGASVPAKQSSSCSFCTESVLQNQKIYEDDQVIVLYDYKPVIEGHCLVIPKRHVERLEHVTPQEMAALHAATTKLYAAAQKTYQATGYLIFQKNGRVAGQDVPHVHFHFFPRRDGDYTDLGIYARMFFLKFKSPLPQKEIDKQRDALANHFFEPIKTQAA